jgi:hypothetical protein
MFPHEDSRKRIEKIILISLLSFGIVYGVTRAMPLLLGPSIEVYYPNDGDYVATSSFEISGQVSRVKEITLQGRPIPIDTGGHFRERLVASPPYTILVLTATDFYGKTVTKTIHIIPQ